MWKVIKNGEVIDTIVFPRSVTIDKINYPKTIFNNDPAWLAGIGVYQCIKEDVNGPGLFKTVVNIEQELVNGILIERHIWYYTDDLDSSKKRAKEIIKDQFIDKQFGGFDYNGSLFDCDESAKTSVIGQMCIINELSDNVIITWRDYNNNYHQFNKSEFKTFALAFFTYYQELFSWKWLKETEIDNSESVSMIASIVR